MNIHEGRVAPPVVNNGSTVLPWVKFEPNSSTICNNSMSTENLSDIIEVYGLPNINELGLS